MPNRSNSVLAESDKDVDLLVDVKFATKRQGNNFLIKLSFKALHRSRLLLLGR